MEVLHNIDPIAGTYSLRTGDYKLIVGSLNEISNNWPGPTGFEDIAVPLSMDEWVFKNDSIVKNILEESNLWVLNTPDEWRKNTVVNCNGPPPADSGGCDPTVSPCLFNIPDDPCEYQNIASKYPRVSSW